jgi:DNA invertase Pin-like site-specific DNA recombinase
MKAAFYLRVSTSDQTTDNQLLDLEQVAKARGWDVAKVYKDEAVSGARKRQDRPALKQMMEDATRMQFGLVAAWSVDRLGRSLSDLLHTSDDLRSLGVELYLHKQAVDTTTPTGRLTYQILGAVSEWERTMIRERVNAGVARAKAKGVKFGRPRELDGNVEANVLRLHLEGGMSLREIAHHCGTSKTTVARLVKAARTQEWLE